VLPALRANPELARVWERRILTRTYDGRSLPVSEKSGALFGMGMTEKQGGSDVRANTTVADPTVDGYRITGHKWFTSAPMCDAFLILAQAPHGITCLLLPRFLPDGSKNQIRIQRLKDKLGNRSNASAELEFEGATAFRVGDEGRGIATIIEMVNNTRLDCVVGSTGLMRQAVAQAGWHSAHRRAFGANLIDKPLMQNVLADLELEVEAATMIMLRLSGAFDRADTDPAEADFRRVATPVAKYWATKRCTPVVRESLECLGGNGYVEESILPRLFRESPVNAIWEGSGNVIALDLLRVLAKQPAALHAMVAELDLARGADKTYDAALDRLADMLGETGEAEARRAIEALALTWAASLLLRHGDEHVADAYVRTRLGGDHGALFGTLPADAALPHLASRTIPRT
jgi:putative acyl-CoA dehydrogenase